MTRIYDEDDPEQRPEEPVVEPDDDGIPDYDDPELNHDGEEQEEEY